MKLKLTYCDVVIQLPSDYSTYERLALVNNITEKYPEEFVYCDKMFMNRYGKKIDVNRLLKIKLEILALYLIKGDEYYTDNVMSRYKETKRPKQEIPFSQLDVAIIELNGYY